jgi:pilus assembly protein Flp/PilA
MTSVFVIVQNLLAETLRRGDRGATAVEYALLATLIAVVIVGVVTALGVSVTAMFSNLANAL